MRKWREKERGDGRFGRGNIAIVAVALKSNRFTATGPSNVLRSPEFSKEEISRVVVLDISSEFSFLSFFDA